MAMTMRVSLPGYDCLTDGTIDHYALYSDNDYVLIKEKSAGTQVLASGVYGTIAHDLGYIPNFMVYTLAANVSISGGSAGYIQCTSGGNISVPIYDAHIDTTNLYIGNNSASSGTFYYFIFYDQQL